MASLTTIAAKLVPPGVKRSILKDALAGGEAGLKAELAKVEPKMPHMLNVAVTAIIGGFFGAMAVYLTNDNACLDPTWVCLKQLGAAGGAGAVLAVANLLRELPKSWDGIDRRGDVPPTEVK